MNNLRFLESRVGEKGLKLYPIRTRRQIAKRAKEKKFYNIFCFFFYLDFNYLKIYDLRRGGARELKTEPNNLSSSIK